MNDLAISLLMHERAMNCALCIKKILQLVSLIFLYIPFNITTVLLDLVINIINKKLSLQFMSLYFVHINITLNR